MKERIYCTIDSHLKHQGKMLGINFSETLEMGIRANINVSEKGNIPLQEVEDELKENRDKMVKLQQRNQELETIKEASRKKDKDEQEQYRKKLNKMVDSLKQSGFLQAGGR